MGNLTKLGGVIAAISMTAYLQGCSSGDSLVQELDPGNSGATVSGTAAKGLLSNADCTVTDTSGNVLFTTVGSDTACTGVNGQYSIPLVVNPTTPVIVTITARSDTTMTCDNPSGCAGGVAFGSPVSQLGDNFSMRAIVPSVAEGSESLNVSVTPWTEVAAARAITSAGGAAAVTAASTQSAYREVAAVLNNILSLDGTGDEFDENFFDIPIPDLANPSTDSVSDATDQKRAALLSIATGALLKQASDSVTVSTVVSNLASSFQDDGEFNVNDDATGIVATDAVNLASIVSDIATTVSTLAAALADNTDGTTALATLLGASDLTTALTTIEESAETLAAAKDAVTDASQDPTKPVELVDSSLSALDKAKQTVAKFVNILNAGKEELNLDDGSNTSLEDLGDVLDVASDEYLGALEAMGYLMEGAASMILDKALDDVSAFSGCTISGDDITCTVLQLVATLDDPYLIFEVTSSSGNIVYTHSNRTVTADGIGINGNTYSFVLQGTASTTAPSYTVASATVDITTDPGTPDISFGTGTATVSGTISNSAGQAFTVNVPDLTMNLADFNFDAALVATRDITIRDTLLTNFRLSGYVEVASTTELSTVATDNKGDRVTFTLAFKGNSGSLSDTTSLPMPTEETESDFLAATGVEFKLSYPTELQIYSVEGALADPTTEATFTAEATGVRNAVKGGDVQTLLLKAVGTGLNASLTGDLTVVDSTPDGVATTTSTWTLGDAATTITLVFVDTSSASTWSVSVTTSEGVSLGTMDATSNGTLALTDPETGVTAELLIPAAVTGLF